MALCIVFTDHYILQKMLLCFVLLCFVFTVLGTSVLVFNLGTG